MKKTTPAATPAKIVKIKTAAAPAKKTAEKTSKPAKVTEKVVKPAKVKAKKVVASKTGTITTKKMGSTTVVEIAEEIPTLETVLELTPEQIFNAEFDALMNDTDNSVDQIISQALQSNYEATAPPAPVVKTEPIKKETPRKISKSRLHLTAATLNLKSGPIEQSDLPNDDIYPEVKFVPLESLTNISTVRGISNAIISAGRIVSVVSDNYGFMDNKDYFGAVEAKLNEANLQYVKRSINRDNCHFAVDYILTGDNFDINVNKKGSTGIDDKITPMIRFTNSYAGGPTSGSFGFFRKVCNNGLHVTEKVQGFGIRHKSNVADIVIPEMDILVKKFMDNEFFTLREKFMVLAETTIKDMSDFVKFTCTQTDIFKYEKSEKNPEPSANAELVMELANVEKNAIGAKEITAWLGYNAFNQVVHSHFNKSFTEQKNLDKLIFNAALQYAAIK